MGKGKYGGKYPRVNRQGDGYYGTNEAGVRQEFTPKGWGTAMGFVGSDVEEYVFSNTVKGTRTITAKSYEEALRIAESLGYTVRDYKKRPRGKRGRY